MFLPSFPDGVFLFTASLCRPCETAAAAASAAAAAGAVVAAEAETELAAPSLADEP